MQIESNVSLQPYNTFGIDSTAKLFARFDSIEALQEALAFNDKANEELFVLGGGSNILLTQDQDKLVLKNDIKGIDVIKEDEKTVQIRVGAGENWHNFVLWCIERDLGGLENLSLIPGNVGASPMQNIGAYGVEIKDRFVSLNAFHVKDRASKIFSHAECEFGYRESVFKRALKGQFIITHVTYKLQKDPTFNTSYGAIEQELERMGVTELSIGAISQAVINIRSSKLPDPKEIGNSGSFFKNPVIPVEKANTLKEAYPTIPLYPVSESEVKAAAGWLIEQAGWKGKRIDNYGVHSKQALVLVNHGGAKGSDIYQLSEDILQSVKDKFDIELEREVNIL